MRALAYLSAGLCCGALLGACADRPIVVGEGGTGGGQSGDVCQNDEDCEAGAECFEGICVQKGLVRVSLSWDVVTDLDLHVETPGGVHLYFENTKGGGGELDVDDCIAGECKDNSATHVENIFFDTSAKKGTYKVWVQNFDGRDGGPYEVEVSGAVNHKWSMEMPAYDQYNGEVKTFTWN